MYKTFTEWKNGNWLEDGEPRKEAYTKDELLLVEMGWKYGFDAGKAQQADRIAELEKELKRTKFAWNLAENEIERLSNKDKSGNSISAEEYQKTHEGFSTIEKVIAKHEAIPSRKEAIDKAREWLKDYRVEAVFDTPQTKPLSDEEIIKIFNKIWVAGGNTNGVMHRFARAIEERHGIK